MTRDDVIKRYIYSTAPYYDPDSVDKVTSLQELMLEMVPTDFHEKCNACPIHMECFAPVPGVGSVNSKIVFVGRNPGEDEDNQGIPFVGRGGQLLNQFISWIGIDRANLYITNLVKCFTTDNRPPKPGEIFICSVAWLRKELELIKPRLIVTFGVEACRTLLGSELKNARLNMLTYEDNDEMRNTIPFLIGTSVIACTHPGAPLRSGAMMKNFRDDAYWVKAKCKELGLVY